MYVILEVLTTALYQVCFKGSARSDDGAPSQSSPPLVVFSHTSIGLPLMQCPCIIAQRLSHLRRLARFQDVHVLHAAPPCSYACSLSHLPASSFRLMAWPALSLVKQCTDPVTDRALLRIHSSHSLSQNSALCDHRQVHGWVSDSLPNCGFEVHQSAQGPSEAPLLTTHLVMRPIS